LSKSIKLIQFSHIEKDAYDSVFKLESYLVAQKSHLQYNLEEFQKVIQNKWVENVGILQL
jgi:hypothetical protein